MCFTNIVLDYNEGDNLQRFASIQAGLTVFSTLGKRVDDNYVHLQLEEAGSHIAQASRHIGTDGFGCNFSKLRGLASIITVVNRHDDIAEDALIGGDENER